jgi:GNAT superfamily N-acetyltransferase
MEIERAVALFVQAYYHLQAQSGGCALGELGGLPCLRFSGELEGNIASEVVVYAPGVEEAAGRITAAAPGLAHWLTLFTLTPFDDLQAGLRLGYVLQDSEILMTSDLSRDSLGPADERVRPPFGADELEQMNAVRRLAVFHPCQLDDPDLRIALIADKGRVFSWGVGLLVEPETVYISHMFTRPDQRRRGLASAVLSALLQQALQRGARRAILVSSQAGRGLYRRLNFTELCDCLILRRE